MKVFFLAAISIKEIKVVLVIKWGEFVHGWLGGVGWGEVVVGWGGRLMGSYSWSSVLESVTIDWDIYAKRWVISLIVEILILWLSATSKQLAFHVRGNPGLVTVIIPLLAHDDERSGLRHCETSFAQVGLEMRKMKSLRMRLSSHFQLSSWFSLLHQSMHNLGL